MVNQLSSETFDNNVKEQITDSLLRIEFQQTLISIKALLDRIVRIIGVKYKGVGSESTFGHFDKETKKGKGFMNFIYHYPDNELFFSHIKNEYDNWIKKAVAPRNRVIHYNDLPIIYKHSFNPNLPFEIEYFKIVHLDKNLKEGIDITDNKQVEKIAYDIGNLQTFVRNLYELFDFTIETIIKK